MPSNRRVRVYSILAVVIFFCMFYFSGSTGRSDRSFYDRSVSGMERNRDSKTANAPKAASSPQIPPPAPGLEDAGSIGATDEKAQIAIGDSSGSRPVKGSGSRRKEKDSGVDSKEPASDSDAKVEAELNSILKRSPIIIFSKSYCPFSRKAKNIFALYSITPAPFIVELDQHELGPPLQAQLLKLTGRRTVPNVLVSGSSIGGGDEVGELHESGELVKKIKDIGGKRIMEARLKGVKEKD